MDVSLRSVLTAGVTAVTASALVMAPSLAPPPLPDVEVHRPVQTMTSTLQLQLSDIASTIAELEQVLTPLVGPAVPTPTSASPTLTNAASDWLISGYQWIQYWVDYGVELAQWILGWIPGGWIIGDQVDIIYYNLILPIADTVVYNFLSPVLNNPLDLAVWWNGAVDVAWSVGASLVNTGIAELNYFVGWLIPPLPPVPWPPLPFAASALAAPLATTPTALAGPIGNAVIDASQALADASNSVWDIWNPIRDNIDYGVGVTSDVLKSWSWIPFVPLADFELNSTWNLIAREGDTLTGLAHDMINAGNQAVADFFNKGLIVAADNAFWTTVDSVNARGGEAVDAVVDYANDQLKYFTPGWALNAAAPTPTPLSAGTDGQTGATLSLDTPKGDPLETKLVVTPDPLTKSPAKAPASVVEALDAPSAPSASSDKGKDGGQSADKAEKAAQKAEKAQKKTEKAEKTAKKERAAARASGGKTKANGSDGTAKDGPSGPAKDTAKKDKAA